MTRSSARNRRSRRARPSAAVPSALGALGIALALVPGCYLSNRRAEADGAPRDAGRDAPLSPGLDAGDAGPLPFDAPLLADTDAGFSPDAPDARLVDGAVSRPDAAPPVERPPDPSTCRIEPTIHPFDDPVLEVRWPGMRPLVDPSAINVCATPLVIDLDTTDGPELEPVVVFVSYEDIGTGGYLRIWNPRTDETITFPDDTISSRVLEESTNLAAGDIDGDGRSEIVGQGLDQGTWAFRHDGTLLWSSPYPTAVERGLSWNRTIGGAVALADLEGDGTVEVIVGRTVLEGADGAHRFTASSAESTRGANGQLGPISCIADLDGDGEQEIIAGRSAIRADGSVMWQNLDAVDGFCAVADIVRGEPGPEVALVSSSYLYILSRDGRMLWRRLVEGAGGAFGSGGPPTIADFDGDGRAEIAIANGNMYGVYDLDCTARGVPDRGCGNAGVRWTQPTEDGSSSSTGSSLFDFNGDGRAEVIYNDQFFFRIYEGASGTVLYEATNSSRTRTENPVVADVDNDGDAEIIFSANSEASFLLRPRDRSTDPGVEIWGDALGRWVGARRIWSAGAAQRGATWG